jgi:hypothetical protein
LIKIRDIVGDVFKKESVVNDCVCRCRCVGVFSVCARMCACVCVNNNSLIEANFVLSALTYLRTMILVSNSRHECVTFFFDAEG